MRWLIASVALLCLSSVAPAEELCPDAAKQPVQEGTRMSEETFEVPAGLDAANKLSEFLNKVTLAYDFNQVVNAFVAKGVILRQQALGARVSLELSRVKQAAGAASKDDVDKTEAAAGKALEAFCRFMVDAVVAE